MSTLGMQNSNLFKGVLTCCFQPRGNAFLLGVSSAASTPETALANTERRFVFGSSVEL